MELYFCGNINDQKLFNKFTLVNTKNSIDNFEIQDIFSVYNNIAFLGQQQNKLYQWNFEIQFQLTEHKKQNDSNSEYTQQTMQVDILELDQFKNQLQEDGIEKIYQTNQNIHVLNQKQEIKSYNGNQHQQLNSSQQKLTHIYPTSYLQVNTLIQKVCCGADHILLLTQQGAMYSMGSPLRGVLGRGKLPQNYPKNDCQVVESMKDYHVVDIACGNDHNLCLAVPKNNYQKNNQGEQKYIFSWGKGDYGCLGQGSSQDYYAPEVIQNFMGMEQNIKQIYCGEVHSYVLLEDGALYSFGNNEFGQLGHINYLPCYQPSKVEINEPIVTFATGNFHALALTNRGNFYSWGTGQFGQLGSGQFQIKQKEPKLVQEFISKNHVEMCIPSIKLFLFNCQTFIYMPNYEMARKGKMDRAKQIRQNNSNLKNNNNSNLNSNKGNSGKEIVKVDKSKKDQNQKNGNIPIFQCFSQDNSFDSSNIADEEGIPQNYQKYQPSPKLEELRSAIKRDKVNLKQRVEKTFYMRSETQEQRRKDLTLIWQNDILNDWKNMKYSPQVKELSQYGIPPNIRDKVWYRCIENRLSITEDYFNFCLSKSQKLKAFLDQKQNKQISSELIQQLETYFFDIQVQGEGEEGVQKINKEQSIKMIENDLHRTFPQIPIFSQDSPVQQNLREVLMAFVSARPDIGYLQGMSYVCALLILYMDKFKAFVCFSNIVTLPSLMPFYMLNEEHLVQRLQLFKCIFNYNLPQLFDHFEYEQIQPKMYVFEWMLTLYTKNLNLDTVCRVWDLMFVQQGPIILYKVAISILKQLESKLIDQDIAGIMQTFKQTDSLIDEEELIQYTQKVVVPSWILKEIEILNQSYIP